MSEQTADTDNGMIEEYRIVLEHIRDSMTEKFGIQGCIVSEGEPHEIKDGEDNVLFTIDQNCLFYDNPGWAAVVSIRPEKERGSVEIICSTGTKPSGCADLIDDSTHVVQTLEDPKSLTRILANLENRLANPLPDALESALAQTKKLELPDVGA